MQVVRESLFVSAFRSFFNAFFSMIGVLIGVIILLIVVGTMTKPNDMDKTKVIFAPDENGEHQPLAETAPVLLKLNIQGVISKDLNHQSISVILDEAKKKYVKHKNRLKGVLLYINSPGGGAIDSDLIYQSLVRFKKELDIPVYAYTEGLCASGGYMIAMSGEKLYANVVSIVGSVGVRLGPLFNFKDFLTEHEIKTKILSAGKNKTGLDPFSTWEEGKAGEAQQKPLMDIIENNYERFITIVNNARPELTKDKLTADFGAEIFDAQTAEQNGYVDSGNATYHEVVGMLAKEAKIEGKYQVVELVPLKPLLNELLDNAMPLLKGKINIHVDGISDRSGEVATPTY